MQFCFVPWSSGNGLKVDFGSIGEDRWKMQLYEGGIRVPAFIYSPLLPPVLRGSVDRRLYVLCLRPPLIFCLYVAPTNSLCCLRWTK